MFIVIIVKDDLRIVSFAVQRPLPRLTPGHFVDGPTTAERSLLSDRIARFDEDDEITLLVPVALEQQRRIEDDGWHPIPSGLVDRVSDLQGRSSDA